MGSKIVLHTFGSLGDLNPYLGIALGLKSMGHAPVIATGGVYREYVEGTGVGFHPVSPRCFHRRQGNDPPGHGPERGMEFLLRGVLLSRLQESYLDLEEALRGASLLVTHPLSFAGHVAAEKASHPLGIDGPRADLFPFRMGPADPPKFLFSCRTCGFWGLP